MPGRRPGEPSHCCTVLPWASVSSPARPFPPLVDGRRPFSPLPRGAWLCSWEGEVEGEREGDSLVVKISAISASVFGTKTDGGEFIAEALLVSWGTAAARAAFLAGSDTKPGISPETASPAGAMGAAVLVVSIPSSSVGPIGRRKGLQGFPASSLNDLLLRVCGRGLASQPPRPQGSQRKLRDSFSGYSSFLARNGRTCGKVQGGGTSLHVESKKLPPTPYKTRDWMFRGTPQNMYLVGKNKSTSRCHV